jgi:hypothetical protein
LRRAFASTVVGERHAFPADAPEVVLVGLTELTAVHHFANLGPAGRAAFGIAA